MSARIYTCREEELASELRSDERTALSATYASLEVRNLLVGKGIRLGNDGDKVNLGVKLAHEFNINGLQAKSRSVRTRLA